MAGATGILTAEQAREMMAGQAGPGQADWAGHDLPDEELRQAVRQHMRLGSADPDSLAPSDWHRWHSSLSDRDLAVAQADYLRVCLTKAKQAEKHLYWLEVRQERQAGMPSDLKRRWLQHQAAIRQLTQAGDEVGLAACRADWASFSADMSWAAWQGGCLTGLYRTCWLWLHRL